MVLGNGVKITWLGHSTFTIVSPVGKIVLIDPWVMGNPACPESFKRFDALDLMLITHGHFDHMGDAVELARRHQPKVVAAYEICVWLESKGVTNTFAMNKGGSQAIDGLTVRMVAADHSGGSWTRGGSCTGESPAATSSSSKTGSRSIMLETPTYSRR